MNILQFQISIYRYLVYWRHVFINTMHVFINTDDEFDQSCFHQPGKERLCGASNAFIDLLLQTRLTNELNCMQGTRVAIDVPAYTHVKTHKLLQTCKQVVTTLFTSCSQDVFALLVPNLLEQVWNKLLTNCNKLDGTVRPVTRLFQQD